MTRAWQINSPDGIAGLTLADHDPGQPGTGEVLVDMRASSINFRDLSTIEDPVSRGLPYPTIPNSDGAGVIAAIGEGVQGLAVGDRVATCFFQAWKQGSVSAEAMASALGGARQGVLAESVKLSADGVIRIPDHLDFEEAATLPCAALTAWNALTLPMQVNPGDTVVLLGTGGVSVFAQQFCKMMGAETIVTSSSDDKLERMRKLGATHTINYRSQPDWDDLVLEITDGKGADRIIEVGGAGTLQKSLRAVRIGGQIALIGILTGVSGHINPTDIMRKSVNLRGIYVGSSKMFGRMNRALSLHKLHPVIDRVFPFEEAPDAYRMMKSANHFGKIVVSIGS